MVLTEPESWAGFTNPTAKQTYLLLSAILLLALILRIIALLSLKETIYFDYLLWDERLYHNWAKSIANGTHKSLSVYAVVTALIYKIFTPEILYVRILNIILGILTCYLVYLIGKEMADRETGLIACLVACLYKPFIFYSIVPLKTSLSVFLFAITIYLFLVILKKPSIFKALFLGIAIGLLCQVRPNFVIIIPLIPCLAFWHLCRSRSSPKVLLASFAIYILGVSISTYPFMGMKNSFSAQPRPRASQLSVNLYIGNNLKNPDPYYRPVPFSTPVPGQQARQFAIEARRRAGRDLTSREASSYWIRELVNMVVEQPAAFGRKLLRKTMVFFNRFEAGDHYHMGFLSSHVWFLKLPFLSLWLILPFGMAGMAATIRSSKNLLALSLIFIAYGLTLIIFFTNTRYRLPILVILIPFAVMGAGHLFTRIKEGSFNRTFIYPAGVTIFFFVITFLPVQGTDDLTAYYNTHALVLNKKGLMSEAIQYWEESSRMNKGFSAYANLSLAGRYLGKRDFKTALQYLNKISDHSFAAANKYNLLGDIMVAQRQIEKAIAAYKKSLEINSGQRRTRFKLVKLYARKHKKKSLGQRGMLEKKGNPEELE